jgi:hypothetical protein
MATRQHLLQTIEVFCDETRTSERKLGDEAVRNPKIISRIRRGDHVTTETIERIEAAMSRLRSQRCSSLTSHPGGAQ